MGEKKHLECSQLVLLDNRWVLHVALFTLCWSCIEKGGNFAIHRKSIKSNYSKRLNEVYPRQIVGRQKDIELAVTAKVALVIEQFELRVSCRSIFPLSDNLADYTFQQPYRGQDTEQKFCLFQKMLRQKPTDTTFNAHSAQMSYTNKKKEREIRPTSSVPALEPTMSYAKLCNRLRPEKAKANQRELVSLPNALFAPKSRHARSIKNGEGGALNSKSYENTRKT